VDLPQYLGQPDVALLQQPGEPEYVESLENIDAQIKVPKQIKLKILIWMKLLCTCDRELITFRGGLSG